MKHPRGVRTRLLTTVVVSVAIALALMTAGFNILLARSLSRDADSVVRTRAATEAASVDLVNDRLVGPDQPDSGGLETQTWVFKNGRALETPRASAALDRAAQSAAAAPGVSLDVPGLATRLFAMPAADYPSVVVVAGVSLGPYRHTQRPADRLDRLARPRRTSTSRRRPDRALDAACRADAGVAHDRGRRRVERARAGQALRGRRALR
jgi:hypothetical protein